MKIKVSVVKCSDYDQEKVNQAVKEALNLIGGIDELVRRGDKVLLVVNLLQPKKPEEGVTTHPKVVSAVCELLRDLGAEIWIGGSSGSATFGGTSEALKICGIQQVAERYGATIINCDKTEVIEINNLQNNRLKNFFIAKPITEADLVISVPKLKSHALVKFTGAIKNFYGVIPGAGKAQGHAIANTEKRFSEFLIDIYQAVNPGLAIMDGVIGMEGDCYGGNLRQVGLILASTSCIALDIVASKIIGYEPWQIMYIMEAIQRGLFPNIESIEEVGVREAKVPFKHPTGFFEHLPGFLQSWVWNRVKAKPTLNIQWCKRCGVCVKACPVNAIKMSEMPIIEEDKCILCYCCHELCPESAIILKQNWLGYFIGKDWQ
ncbi:MAG: DUF362 domain-containing protein [bacterium]